MDKIDERKEFLACIESCLERNNFQTVCELAQARLQNLPGDVDAKLALCHALIRMGRLGEGLELLSQVEDAVISLGRIYASLGDTCQQSGLIAESIRYYERYITLDPLSRKSEEIRKKLRVLRKDHIQTEEQEVPEDGDPAPEFCTLTMADLYIKQGHLDMAERVLERIVKREGQNEEASLKLAEVRAKQREKIVAAFSEKKKERIIAELERWLGNLGRMKAHAA